MNPCIDVGTATRPHPGEEANGDAVLVSRGGEELLVAVIDGLGHGPAAAEAANAATDFISANRNLPLPTLISALDRAISGTRGVALAILRIDLVTFVMTHVGIGNVEVTSCSQTPFTPLAVPGVVGGRVRKIVESRGVLQQGDRVFIYTDGISRRFHGDAFRRSTAQDAAAAVLAQWSRETDDATCVVISG